MLLERCMYFWEHFLLIKKRVAHLFISINIRQFYWLKKKKLPSAAHISVSWMLVVVVGVQPHRWLEGQIQRHWSMGFSEPWKRPLQVQGFLSCSFLQVQYLPFGNRRKLPVSLKDHMGAQQLMILGSFFTSRGAFKGRFLLPLLAPLKWEESLPFVRPGRVAAISQLLLWICGLWIWSWDFGLSWFLVCLHLLPLLEPECLVRTASELLSFFTLQLRLGREVTVSPQSSSGNISFTVFPSSFWPLCWLVSLPFFSVWFLWTLFLHYHCPSRVFISCPTLLYLFLCLFCGMAQERNSDSLRSPLCIESQNHPVLSFSYSSDFYKVKDSLL